MRPPTARYDARVSGTAAPRTRSGLVPTTVRIRSSIAACSTVGVAPSTRSSVLLRQRLQPLAVGLMPEQGRQRREHLLGRVARDQFLPAADLAPGVRLQFGQQIRMSVTNSLRNSSLGARRS
ncbi:hypothetical protein KAF44_22690 (plasmid) [Cupriavidus necator]|nr:hypothetical protein KAF44_22690 [Cupriavidus necator]